MTDETLVWLLSYATKSRGVKSVRLFGSSQKVREEMVQVMVMVPLVQFSFFAYKSFIRTVRSIKMKTRFRNSCASGPSTLLQSTETEGRCL